MYQISRSGAPRSRQRNCKNTNIPVNVICILIFTLLAVTCGPSGPRDLKSAREDAISYFDFEMVELNIDDELFEEPSLITETDDYYVFEWRSKVPVIGATIIEMSVPKAGDEIKGMHITGPRAHLTYLRGTTHFPLNEAMLSTLFGFAPSDREKSERKRRIRLTSLDRKQQEDIASFIEIKLRLMQYEYCFNGSYPISLNEIREYSRGLCFIHGLDSLYTHDRYGREYFYQNLLNFVLIGSLGDNNKWDFDDFVLDSLYNDDLEHIVLNGDDILVKFRPVDR